MPIRRPIRGGGGHRGRRGGSGGRGAPPRKRVKREEKDPAARKYIRNRYVLDKQVFRYSPVFCSWSTNNPPRPRIFLILAPTRGSNPAGGYRGAGP